MSLFEDDDWGHAVDASGDFARVEQLAGHLLIILPVGYIQHSPTRFTVPGKKSDVIVCDIVDLDAADDQGQPGKIYRTAWLRQSQLIMSLRPFVGKKVLARISKGVPRNGMNPPWVVNDTSTEPGAPERARAWGAAHPEFVTSPFSQPTQAAPPQDLQPQFRPAAPQYQQAAPPQQFQPQPQPAYGYPPAPQPQPQPPQFQPQPFQQQPQYQQTLSPTAAPAYQATVQHQFPQQPPAIPAFPVQQQGYPQQPADPGGDTTLAYMRAQYERRNTTGGGNDTPGDPPF